MKKIIFLLSIIFNTFLSNAQIVSTFVSSGGSPWGICMDNNGNLYFADISYNNISKITPNGILSILAGPGTVQNDGYIDGIGTAARFQSPREICIDQNGNLYVADSGNHRIRKITSSGVVTTFAGSTAGFTDGIGTAAQFNQPSGICIDPSGNLYVADMYNNKIRKISPAGVVSTFAGSTSGFIDGQGTNAKFFSPMSMGIDNLGICMCLIMEIIVLERLLQMVMLAH